jgi:branched-chain amino acid transport system substrate-binding protein
MAYVAGKLGMTNPTMAIAVSDTTYGNNLDAGFTKITPNIFNVVDKVAYPLNTADLSSVAARLIAKNPDVIFNEGYPADGLQFGTLFSSKFTTTAKIMFTIASEGTALTQLGAKGNGMLLAGSLNTTVKGVPQSFLDFNTAYKAKYGSAPILQSVWGYESVLMIAAALEKAGSVDPAKVAAALHQVSLDHSTGNLFPQDKISFDAQGRISNVPAFFDQIQDGKLVAVFPAEQAAAQPIAYRG